MRTVKSSNLPMSMRMARNHLVPDGSHAKLSVGPTFPSEVAANVSVSELNNQDLKHL
jgi:hypothetical protein